jgi:ribosomal protein S18 acetylase RimI-like enzyme
MTTLTLPDAYIWRPLQLADLPALHTLFLRTAAPDERVDSLETLESEFDDPWSNPATDTLAAFTQDGRLVAAGRCLAHPTPEREASAFLWMEIEPDQHTRGLEQALLDWLEARGRERLQGMPAHLPCSLRTAWHEARTHEIATFSARGFRPIRYFYSMRRDLHSPIPDRPLSAGIVICPYTPEREREMYQVFDAAFLDHWGHEPVIRADWEQFFIGSPNFRPDLSLLALADDRVVGLAFNMVRTEDNLRLGRQEGLIHELGVLRAWRRRGVATALLCESMRRFRAAGLDYAVLGVDTENPSGALALYEGLGFVTVRTTVVLDKQIR